MRRCVRAEIERELARRLNQEVLSWFGYVEIIDVYRMARSTDAEQKTHFLYKVTRIFDTLECLIILITVVNITCIM